MGIVNYTWTPEDCETLTALWEAGQSATQIAHRMGGKLTRSSVLSKVRRMKLPYRIDKVNAAARAWQADRRKMAKPVQPAKANIPSKPCDASEPALLSGHRITIETVRDGMCRWPIGSDQEMYLCGNSSLRGRPYCASHCAAAYQSSRPAPSDKPVHTAEHQFRSR